MATKEEQRDEVIAELTEKHLAARIALLLNNDMTTIRDVGASVLDYLSTAEDLSTLVIGSQYASRAVTGKKFVDVVNLVMRDAAQAQAEREVDAIERAAKDDPDNCKPKGKVARWMQEQEAKFE